jgi:predicted transcriptional regulator of viral defense system
MRLNTFFLRHPVFTTEEVADFLRRRGSDSRWTQKALLAHHEQQGHVVRLRRGVYATVPPGVDPADVSVDHYLVASKLTDDAVLAYHTALEFHGKAYSAFSRFFYLTTHRTRPCTIGSQTFTGILVPKALRAKGAERAYVREYDRSGLSVSVTTFERTLVDVLDRPQLSGSWEEIWRSLESIEFFDLDVLVEYALLLENATTIAKVGYFLDQHRERLMVEDSHLDPLKRHRPKQPHYMDRKEPGQSKLRGEWNLIVPAHIAERAWEEVG